MPASKRSDANAIGRREASCTVSRNSFDQGDERSPRRCTTSRSATSHLRRQELVQLVSDRADSRPATDRRREEPSATLLSGSMTGSVGTPGTDDRSSSDLASSNLTLAFSIDPGTSTYASSFRLVKPDVRPRCHDVKQVLLPPRDITGPMIAAWHGNAFFFGNKLQDQVENGEIDPGDIIRLPKIALYDGYSKTEEAQVVQQQLDEVNKAPLDLWTEIFRAIWNEVMAYIQTHRYGKCHEYASWRKQLFISVPKSVTFETTSLLAAAAERASLPTIQFVSEPLCAAAHTLQNMLENRDISFPHGEECEVIVLDGGGGTVDIASFRVKENRASGNDGARCLIEALDESGALCGSEFVGGKMISWLRRWLVKEAPQRTAYLRHLGTGGDGIAAAARYLNISPSRFRQEALEKFEQYKRAFAHADGKVVNFSIYGGIASDLKDVRITIESKTMRSFFDPLIDEIVKMVRGHISSEGKTKEIIATGGFGRSPYLQARLNTAFPNIERLYPTGIDCFYPVSNGAVLRFDVIDTSNLRSSYSFGVIQDEEFDCEIHADGIEEKDRRDESKKLHKQGEDDCRVVFKDPIDKSLTVLDRIQWLVRKDDAAEDGWFTSKLCWQDGHIDIKTRLFTATIVVSDADELRDHEPLYDKVSGRMYGDFHILTTIKTELSAELIRAYVNGGRKKKRKNLFVRRKIDGEYRDLLKVRCSIVLRHNEMTLQGGLRIEQPENTGTVDEGVLPTIEDTIWGSLEWPETHTHRLWDARRDPTIHDNVVGMPMPADTFIERRPLQARATIIQQPSTSTAVSQLEQRSECSQSTKSYACRTCYKQHKKCDSRYPTCSACQKTGVRCEYQDPRTLSKKRQREDEINERVNRSKPASIGKRPLTSTTSKIPRKRARVTPTSHCQFPTEPTNTTTVRYRGDDEERSSLTPSDALTLYSSPDWV